jgi:phosphomannomutase
MEFNQNIFKKYDIRGVYGQDFEKSFAYQLGLAYIAFLKKKKPTIIVSRDMRLSSPILSKEVTRGLRSAGAKVIDIGLNSAPTFYFAVAKFKYDGGIMVSASHNPKEWNGFKVVKAKAYPISQTNGLEEIKKLILSKKLKPSKQIGTLIKKGNILRNQIKYDLQYAKAKKIKKFKIVIDAANAMGAQYFNELFKHIPAKLIKMNFKLDGNFPAHEADPLKEENLIDLKKVIKKEKADFGIATDGDGDRIFFVDDQGQTIDPAIIRGLLAKIFLAEKPKSKIAYDVRPGKITLDLIKQNNGQPILTPVGHSLIKEIMIKQKAYFAGESSGHFFLNLPIGCFEVPVIVLLKLMQHFSAIKEPISEYLKQYRVYCHSGEINREVGNKEKAIKQIEKEYKNGKINKLDGISVEYKNFWFNLRPSNTENKIRLNVEAVDKKTMERERDKILKIIK